jgi:hypothetical protein
MATPPQQQDRQPQQDRQRLDRPQQSAGELGLDVTRLDDFEVIRERRNIMAALATLTDQYRALNHEMSTRQTLKWMVAS